MIDEIRCDGVILAIIVPADFDRAGIHFVTPPEFSQQLAYMRHPAGKRITPHVHNQLPREVIYTQEVLLIRRGRLRVDFYDTQRNYLHSRILGAGDTILLAGGGHGFEALEDLEMIEIKQGPHAGEADKTRFAGIDSGEVRIIDV